MEANICDVNSEAIQHMIKKTVADALKSYSLPKPENVSQPTFLNKSNHAVNQSHFPNSLETNSPEITKYAGKSNVAHFIEDLEARFTLQPYSHNTDRKKIIVAVEHLRSSENDETSDAPKEWARLELSLNPWLKDNWLAFAEKLRNRYQNTGLRQMKVQERQNLKQFGNTVQWYKQRYELLCYETNFPKQVWGEEFYKGLSLFIKDKLASVASLDRQNYEVLSYHAIQFDEVNLSRQRERAFEKQNYEYFNKATKPFEKLTFNAPSIISNNVNQPQTQPQPRTTDTNGRITQEVREYRKANNLCMFDGGNHRTHLCTKLIEKCKKEGKPMPIDPATLPHKVQNTPKPSTSLRPALTISSLNNCQIIEVVGEIHGMASTLR